MSNLNSHNLNWAIRCRIPAAVCGCYAASQIMIWNWAGFSEPLRFQLFVLASVTAGIAGAIWCLFTRSLNRTGKLAGVVLCSVGAFLSTKAIRADGYLGDASPNLVWSWSPPAAAGFDPALQTVERPAETQLDLELGPFDSPGFLGPDRDARVRGVQLVTDWQQYPPRELWRREVGEAWSSFAVAGNVVVTQEQRGDAEATVCYDLETGVQRWAHLESNTRFEETYAGAGPRATPSIDNGRVYSLGATGILNCLDGITGQQIWRTNILDDAGADNLGWGMAGSPLVLDDLIVVNAGGTSRRSVIAYRADDGQVAWYSGTGQAAYSSPMQANIAGVPQVVLLNGPGLEGYEARCGQPLWNFAWEVNGSMMTSITQPVRVGPNRFFLSSGYGKGCVLLEVRRSQQKFQADAVWPPNRQLKSKMSSIVFRDGFVYGLDEKVLVCLDLATGKRRWKAGRYGHGQLLLVDDVLLIQAESGDVVLVSATPDGHQELTRFTPLPTKTWTAPVLVKNKLLVRSDREAACYELPVVRDGA